MPASRSIFILFFVSLAIAFTALPSMAKSDNNSKLLPYTIKSASELDYPPFSIVRDDGTADGFSVDLLKAVVQSVGLEISFEVGPWNEIKQKLINGSLDVLPLHLTI